MAGRSGVVFRKNPLTTAHFVVKNSADKKKDNAETKRDSLPRSEGEAVKAPVKASRTPLPSRPGGPGRDAPVTEQLRCRDFPVIRVVPRFTSPLFLGARFFVFEFLEVIEHESQSLRRQRTAEMFLSFFESKGHLRLPSFSLIPQNDASLLLINSGMAP